MLLIGSVIVDVTTEVGLVAGMIAVGGFLGHVVPTFQEKGEQDIRLATVRGGLCGIGAVVALNLIVAVVW